MDTTDTTSSFVSEPAGDASLDAGTDEAGVPVWVGWWYFKSSDLRHGHHRLKNNYFQLFSISKEESWRGGLLHVEAKNYRWSPLP